ncbi:acetate--CoA ligase [Fulvivirgaceae bacterium PWU4]|uniref:Acetate--CoA ligase n=1 Tax=Chryseosolibacter histidini TaxID=2782349 RepID=A0AAP2GQW8_9BACT|nr:acetate--CoA ligase [Chryseosolibacter histidini]MBT1698962.1 acetate--CoA ligase [Chryseosolibacter histidini]
MGTIRSFEDYQEQYKKSIEDPEAFWATIAGEFQWRKKWNKVLEWDFHKPEVKWFIGGKLNITENCIDRHLPQRAKQTAIIWEPNNPKDEALHITYQQLSEEVGKTANMLKAQGVKKGDRVCVYLPMIPQLAYTLLACARIGAVHSVVFAGFSAKSLIDRITDAGSTIVVTADGGFRGDKTINLKGIVDEALEKCPDVSRVIVYEHTKTKAPMKVGRDLWWHEEIKKVNAQCPAEEMDAEDLLFILYTSGSTGKPKGMVHTCGGYMVYTNYTFRTAFNYEEGQVYWCTADIGWITGHSYILYGPLSAGATTVMFEGVPSWPDWGRFWQAIERHKINIFYTAPTAIRSLEKAPISFVESHDLSSLKVLGTVGEPINEEAWNWYDKNIGKGKCPIIDTWWQTETGGFMISPIAHATKLKPAFATLPLPGVQPAVMNESGLEIKGNNIEGRLTIKFPWPSMARTIYGDHQRFKDTYFSTFPGKYFTGDGCKRDEDGYYRITGRVDDIIIVSGHNLGTAEIESAITEHKNVVETAVVGFPHDIKGQAVYAFVILHDKPGNDETLRGEIRETVSKIIGPIAKPDKIQFVSGLPKTRSGKIMRRILRKVAEGDTANLGDTSTLLDPAVVDEIKAGAL